MSTKSSSYSGQAFYDSLPTAADRRIHQENAEFYRNAFTWTWYITLTFSESLSAGAAWQRLEDYLRLIEETHRTPLSCMIAQENKYSGLGIPTGRIHFHLLVFCPTNTVSLEMLTDTWKSARFGGDRTKGASADVRHYLPDGSAAYYLLKNLHHPSFDLKLRTIEGASKRRSVSFATSNESRRRWRRQQERKNAAFPSIITSSARQESDPRGAN